MSEFGEIWDGPGDDWYPGSDPDENDGLSSVSYYGDSMPDDNDNLIREGIYAAGDSGDPDDHPPTYEEDPSFYDDGITTDDFDHWPSGREFPS